VDVQTTATNLDALIKQGVAQPNLGDSRIDFAMSLCKQALHGKKSLSEKQQYWLGKLYEMATTPKPEPTVIDLGADMQGLLALFSKAKGSKLKSPKIRIEVAGQKLCISLAGNAAKHPGSINVTDGKPFGENKWFGRILTDGTWMPGKAADELPILEDFLSHLASKPAETAAAYGKASGNCCFCNTEIKTAESMAVGYGPVCANKWGLPWGKKHVH